MTSNAIVDTPKVPRLHSSNGFALWRLHGTELMRRNGLLHVFTESPPNPDTATSKELQIWHESDRKAIPQIVLNPGVEPATLVTSLLIFDGSTKDACGKDFVAATNEKTSSRFSIFERDYITSNLQKEEIFNSTLHNWKSYLSTFLALTIRSMRTTKPVFCFDHFQSQCISSLLSFKQTTWPMLIFAFRQNQKMKDKNPPSHHTSNLRSSNLLHVSLISTNNMNAKVIVKTL